MKSRKLTPNAVHRIDFLNYLGVRLSVIAEELNVSYQLVQKVAERDKNGVYYQDVPKLDSTQLDLLKKSVYELILGNWEMGTDLS